MKKGLMLIVPLFAVGLTALLGKMDIGGNTSPTNGVEHLVIRCMDYRFREKGDQWIRKALKSKADLLAWPGVTVGFDRNHVGDWMLESIEATCRLHNITTVHLQSHHDCGGHGGITLHKSPEKEKAYHKQCLEKTANIIGQKFPNLTIKCYYIDFNEVHLVHERR